MVVVTGTVPVLLAYFGAAAALDDAVPVLLDEDVLDADVLDEDVLDDEEVGVELPDEPCSALWTSATIWELTR